MSDLALLQQGLVDTDQGRSAAEYGAAGKFERRADFHNAGAAAGHLGGGRGVGHFQLPFS